MEPSSKKIPDFMQVSTKTIQRPNIRFSAASEKPKTETVQSSKDYNSYEVEISNPSKDPNIWINQQISDQKNPRKADWDQLNAPSSVSHFKKIETDSNSIDQAREANQVNAAI